MQSLSCPTPTDIIPLHTNGFILNILKIPEISFFCTSVSLPTISLPTATHDTRFSRIKEPGDKPEYSTLSVSFKVDSLLNNYIAVYNWITGLGFPEDIEQFKRATETDNLNTTRRLVSVSEGTLAVLDNYNNPARIFKFSGLIPTELSFASTFDSNVSDTTYLTANVEFELTEFKIS